ncbi:MAG: hypothetical protein ACJA0G_000135, partial [Kangiellaceae bacterium]
QIQENNHGESHQSFPWIGLLISLLITALAMYLIIEVLPPPPSDDFYGY